MSSQVPVIDLAPWFSGDEEARAAVAAEVDGALRSVGFFLISGHGVAGELRARVRDSSTVTKRYQATQQQSCRL